MVSWSDIIVSSSSSSNYYRSIIGSDQTIHNNRPDIVILDKTTNKAYPIEVAIPNCHNLHSAITEKLDLK